MDLSVLVATAVREPSVVPDLNVMVAVTPIVTLVITGANAAITLQLGTVARTPTTVFSSVVVVLGVDAQNL